LADLKAARAELARTKLAKSHLELAARFYLETKYSKAAAIADEALRLDPKCTGGRENRISALEIRGQCYFQMGQYEKALVDFNSAIGIWPAKAHLYLFRGKSWCAMHQYVNGIDDFGKAIRLNPEEIGAFNNRGQTWVYIEEHDKAIADLDEAIRLGYDGADAFGSRGMAWNAKKEYRKAIADFDRAIQLDQGYARAYRPLRGAAFLQICKYSEAIKDFESAMRRYPADDTSYGLLAWVLATCTDEQFRDEKRAVRTATKACEMTEWQNVRLLRILSMAYRANNQAEDADRVQRIASDLSKLKEAVPS
jgi:tetratricopeptide (TPR) repeat protein